MEIDDVDFVTYQVESVRMVEQKVEMSLLDADGDRLRVEFFGVLGLSWKGAYTTGDWHLADDRREIRDALDFRNRHDRDFSLDDTTVMELILWTEENLEYFSVIFHMSRVVRPESMN